MKSIPKRKFIAYLKKLGLVHKRTTASHQIWNREINPLQRPVIFRTTDRDIPILHIHTALRNLGISKERFERDIKDC